VSEEYSLEDQAVVAALATLATPAALEPSAAPAVASEPLTPQDAGTAPDSDGEKRETLTRLYQELLGLVPAALPPLLPRPEVKRRLMAAIAGLRPAQAVSSATPDEAAVPQPPPFPHAAGVAARSEVRPAAVADPAAAPAAASASLPPAPAAKKAGRGWMALAATLLLALAGTCGWLYRGLLDQETIARLRVERNLARQQAGRVRSRLERRTADLAALRDNVAVATSPAVEVCALRPIAPAVPEASGASGVIFVAADHQHWYLSLHGLQPAGPGKVYQLWFMGDQGPVSGGTFSAITGATSELGSAHMPAGIKEVKVTLESGAGSATPSGPEVLHSAEPFRVL
jgi:hypothetical protein